MRTPPFRSWESNRVEIVLGEILWKPIEIIEIGATTNKANKTTFTNLKINT